MQQLLNVSNLLYQRQLLIFERSVPKERLTRATHRGLSANATPEKTLLRNGERDQKDLWSHLRICVPSCK